MEIIRPFPLDPWQRSLGELITTIGSSMQELHEAGHAHLWLFTSVSVRNGLVGMGLIARVNQIDIVSSYRTVGKDDSLNAHYAQLGAVLEAVSYVKTMLPRIQMSPWKIQVMIVVNNPAVLLSLAKPHLQGGQALIARITEAIGQLSESGAKVSLTPRMKSSRILHGHITSPAKQPRRTAKRILRLGRKSSSGRRRCDGLGRTLNSTEKTTSNCRPRANLHAS